MLSIITQRLNFWTTLQQSLALSIPIFRRIWFEILLCALMINGANYIALNHPTWMTNPIHPGKFIACLLAGIIIFVLLTTIIYHKINYLLLEQTFSLRQAWQSGLQQGMTVLSSLALLAVTIITLSTLIIGGLSLIFATQQLSLISLFLAIIFMIYWCMTLPIIVVENKSAFAASVASVKRVSAQIPWVIGLLLLNFILSFSINGLADLCLGIVGVVISSLVTLTWSNTLMMTLYYQLTLRQASNHA